MVGLGGLEPPTSRLSGARSNHLSYEPMLVFGASLVSLTLGGDDGNRTHDPLLAGQVLSQLSYTPILISEKWRVKSEKLLLKSFAFSHLFYLWGYWVFLTVTQNWTTMKDVLGLVLVPYPRRLFWFGLFSNYDSSTALLLRVMFSIERRWSSRTFRYGYLVTT